MRQVRCRASGWLPIRPSRYSTVLPHLFSRNLSNQYLHPSSSFCSTQQCLPVLYQRRCLDAPASSFRPSMRTSDAFRYATHTDDSKEMLFSLARFRSGLTNRLRKTESNRWETKTSRRPKDPQPMQIASSWECCSRLQNGKQTKAFRSSQEDACQWTTSRPHTAQ